MKKILIADDEHDWCVNLPLFLKTAGHGILQPEERGFKVLERCRTESPDLLILDNFFLTDGADASCHVLPSLREDSLLRELPVIVMSAFDTDESASSLSNAKDPFTFYLPKSPQCFEYLVTLIDRIEKGS